MLLCYTDPTDKSPEVDCDTLREYVTSQREHVADFSCDVSKADDDTHEMANHPCTQTATVDTSTRLSPALAVETVCAASTVRPSKLKKFVDRRTETLISACATVSTSAVDEAGITRDTSDVIDKRKSNEQVTSPVLRLTKYRDQQLDVRSPLDRRQLGVVKDVTLHRSMATSVPVTTTTTPTSTSVNVVRSPASLIVLRSEWPERDATAAVPSCNPTITSVVSPSCNAESRLTVTLTESSSQQSQRSCRLITRSAAVTSTKPCDIAGSGSESTDNNVSARPLSVQSPVALRRPRLRRVSSSGHSVAEGDAEISTSVRPSSTVCVFAQLSPFTVQPSSGTARPTSSDRQVPTTSSVAAADVTSTPVVISRRAVFEVKSPSPQSTVNTTVSELALPVNALCSSESTFSRHPATVPSPLRHEQGPAVKTEGLSAMTAFDDALAMLTSVVSENCQTQNCHSHPAIPASPDSVTINVITAQPAQATCKSSFIGQSPV